MMATLRIFMGDFYMEITGIPDVCSGQCFMAMPFTTLFLKSSFRVEPRAKHDQKSTRTSFLQVWGGIIVQHQASGYLAM